MLLSLPPLSQSLSLHAPRWLAFTALEGMSVLMAVGATMMQAADAATGSDVTLELIRLLGGILATGGIVWKAMDVWQRRQSDAQEQQRAILTAMQTEIVALRERDEQRQERAEQQARADITYYRQLLGEERARTDSCQEQLRSLADDTADPPRVQ